MEKSQKSGSDTQKRREGGPQPGVSGPSGGQATSTYIDTQSASEINSLNCTIDRRHYRDQGIANEHAKLRKNLITGLLAKIGSWCDAEDCDARNLDVDLELNLDDPDLDTGGTARAA